MGEARLTKHLRDVLLSIAQCHRNEEMAYVVSATQKTALGEVNVQTARALWRRGLVIWDNRLAATYLYPSKAGWKVVFDIEKKAAS